MTGLMWFFPPSLVVCLAVFAMLAPGLIPPPPANGKPLTHEAYVWQRKHTADVVAAVAERGGQFRQLTFLATEINWEKGSAPEIARIDLSALASGSATTALGLALRAHAIPGRLEVGTPAARRISDLAVELIQNAAARSRRIDELQIDFDAAESQLDSYALCLAELRRTIAPVRLAFTALPAWLDHTAAFGRLARSADSFILQVHSLALPDSPRALPPLCEAGAALRAIRRAAKFGVPFRAALPTYGYEVCFDARRRYKGIAADGSARAWPAGSTVRTVRADPAAMAGLVSVLQRQHPAALTGLAWYRLPVGEETLNWPWPALAAVMQGRVPAASVSIEADASPADPALFRIAVRNSGEDDAFSLHPISLDWSGARLVAADALAGFSYGDEADGGVKLSASSGFRLPPGRTRAVGWMRFDRPPSSFHVTPDR